jgi:hypothetical protein
MSSSSWLEMEEGDEGPVFHVNVIMEETIAHEKRPPPLMPD